MIETRDIFHICLGFFLGFMVMLGLVASFQFIVTKDVCLSSLYEKAHMVAQGLFTIQK